MRNPALDQILHKGRAKLLFVQMLERGFAHAHLMGGTLYGSYFIWTGVYFIPDGRKHLIPGIRNHIPGLKKLLLNFQEKQPHIGSNALLPIYIGGIRLVSNRFHTETQKIQIIDRNGRIQGYAAFRSCVSSSSSS